MIPKTSSEKERARGVDLRVGAIQKIGDHIRTLHFLRTICFRTLGFRVIYLRTIYLRTICFQTLGCLIVYMLSGMICRMFRLEVKGGVLLIAFRRKTDVVELHFIDSSLGHEFRQGDVVILHFGVRGIGPDQLAVFPPGLASAMRLHGQFRVARDQMFVAEDGDAGDGVHVFGMQEVNELGQVGNVVALSAGQRVVEGDVDDAVAILYIEDHRIAADLSPMSDDAQSMIAARHHSGQINGADFEISCHWNGAFSQSARRAFPG